MHPTELLHTYGYAAVVVGTFFEGELIMLAAGLMAAAGLLQPAGVIAAGMLGIFLSDTFCFFLGRFAGHRLGRWFPRLFSRLRRVFELMEHYDQKLVVFFQFFPGLCTVTPVAYGMTRISVVRFMALDLLGNALWTLFFAFLGYGCGRSALHALAVFHQGWWIFAVVAAAGYATWALCRRLRQPKHNNPWSAPEVPRLSGTGTSS